MAARRGCREFHCEKFNDVNEERDIESTNLVIIGQISGWIKAGFLHQGVYGLALPRVSLNSFEQIVEDS